jgi:hypothetical protein
MSTNRVKSDERQGLRRYATTVPEFLWLVALQLLQQLGLREFPVEWGSVTVRRHRRKIPMRLLQRAVYAAKRLSHSAIGRIAIRAAKVAAGSYFDVFRRFYRTDGMIFYVPREQTTLSLRGKFVVDTYELPERTLVKRHLRRGATVLELGGGIGVLSCLINRRLDASLTKRAYLSAPWRWRTLRRSIAWHLMPLWEPTSHLVIETNPNLIPVLERNRHINHANSRIENCVISRGNVANIAISRDMDSSMDIDGGEATFILQNIDKLRQIQFLMAEFHPDTIGDPMVDRLRGVLRSAGLEKVDDILANEIYARRAS